MNNFNLTWDLFIIVFFFIVIAYSIMIGREKTIKIILSSYIAILASDAIGNGFAKMLTDDNTSVIQFNNETKAIILAKIAIFVILTVLLTIRGAFDVVVAEEKSHFIRFMMTMSYGILSAGLIISTILAYVTGTSFFAASFAAASSLQNIAIQSNIVTIMVEYYIVWFSLPAIVFMVSSLFTTE